MILILQNFRKPVRQTILLIGIIWWAQFQSYMFQIILEYMYIWKNLTKFQLQFQLQLPRVSTPIPTPTPASLLNINSNSNSGSFNSNSKFQLWQVSWISTPTPEVSTPIPTPTPELELELNPTPTPELTPTLLKMHTNKTRMKFEFLKSHPDLPGTNELITCTHCNCPRASQAKLKKICKRFTSTVLQMNFIW